MPRIHYTGRDDGLAFEALAGETILAVSLRNGIDHARECNGRARCTTCRVRISDGLEMLPPRSVAEADIATRLGWKANERLACQTPIVADVSVERMVAGSGGWGMADEELARPRECEVAVLFADIEGFSQFTSQHMPYDIVHVLNRFYRAVGQPVLDAGGRIDNYLGDGLLALFESAESGDHTTRTALRAALAMQIAFADFQVYAKATFGWTPGLRIGLHFGTVVAGEVGHPEVKRTTVIGDAVNVACRIEDANKALGTRLLASAAFAAPLAAEVRTRVVDGVMLPGYGEAFQLHEIVDFADLSAARSLAMGAELFGKLDEFAVTFYTRLFELRPELRALFAGTDWAALRAKLAEALRLVVAEAGSPGMLAGQLRALGQRHVGLGVRDADYDLAVEAFAWALEAQALSEAERAAWREVFGAVVTAMRGSECVMVPEMT